MTERARWNEMARLKIRRHGCLAIAIHTLMPVDTGTQRLDMCLAIEGDK